MTLTGAWARKANANAKKIGNLNVVFDGSGATILTPVMSRWSAI
jgi:hypothetical protein